MIVYAVNIHTGGGKVLLDTLIVDQPLGPITKVYADARYKTPANKPANIEVVAIKPTLFSRLRAEIQLYKAPEFANAKEVLFFGNLPPLFRPFFSVTRNKKFILYLQNAFLIKKIPLPSNSLKQNLKLLIERCWLNAFLKTTDQVWVQNDWMKNLVQHSHPGTDVYVKPFLPNFKNVSHLNFNERLYQFIYVGSSSKHKRLNFFLEALSTLDKKLQNANKTIKVCIILESGSNAADTKSICALLRNIDVELTLNASREQIFDYYSNSKYLVATSLIESFYLPIYEANHYGCKIIAPEDVGYTQNLNLGLIRYKKHTLNLSEYL